MKLVIEALEAARAHLGREYLDGRQPTASTAPTGEKIDRALAAIAEGQAVTTADVEAWASTADVFELGQAALAIRARNRVIAGKLDELERPLLLQPTPPGRPEIPREFDELADEPPSSEALETAAGWLERAIGDKHESPDVAVRDDAADVEHVADWLRALARLQLAIAGTETLGGAARGLLVPETDPVQAVAEVLASLSLGELELIALAIKSRVAGVADELEGATKQ